MSQRVLPGTPQPLGAHWDGHGVNFALFSANASRVQLCLFDPQGEQEIERIELQQSDDIWHLYLSDCGAGTIYGYRVDGLWQPQNGHWFNPHKLLLDPYARALHGSLSWDQSVVESFDRDDSNSLQANALDNAAFVPKGVVVDELFDWQQDQAPRIPWSKTVIYETHVRGFTRLFEKIDADLRGSYAALASEPVIDYLTSLGITSLELLPVHSFIDDQFLVDKGLVNYWGYNTIGFFAVESRYSASGQRDEFKHMVKRLHAANIEVLLDVVYNHTAEGGATGPTLSFRGIDNLSYYRLATDDLADYINHSGCGNSLDLTHPRVLQMVIDSLRYWVTEMHVDGFRFDLAVSLGRGSKDFDDASDFFRRIEQDEILSQVKLIAEPWDIGPEGYQLGAFPPDWAEWNDRFRDGARRFWRRDADQLPELARSLHGSSDLFEHNGRRPSASINMVTSHDGFTLRDLVSYNRRHNLDNGEDNHDGHGANFSHNHGCEGETESLEINALRLRQQKNLLATLFLSKGTPMLLAGDEIGRSQKGNNNAYCQDTPVNWQDWSAIDDQAELLALVRQLIQLRQTYPLLHRNIYPHATEQFEPSGFSDIQWFRADGLPMQTEDWHRPKQHFLAMLVAAEALPERNPLFDPQKEEALLVVFNANLNAVDLVLPNSESCWHCLITTADSSPQGPNQTSVTIEPQSVYLFELKS